MKSCAVWSPYGLLLLLSENDNNNKSNDNNTTEAREAESLQALTTSTGSLLSPPLFVRALCSRSLEHCL